MPQFRNGSIKLLRLENFQTFKRAEFSFCSSLNFIAGPNGSGKSSIANAIALVFGGSPRTIGKTKLIGEYVRFGEDDGSVEAVIWMNEKDVKIKRCIGRDNHSRYFIDGRQFKKMEYDAFINEFRANVDNLCQFLPQERVSEFARLSPENLLIETLSAIEDSEVLRELKKLDDFEKEVFGLRGMIESCVKQKDGMEQVMRSISRDLEKIREKERKEERIKLMYDKKDWIWYATHLDEYLRIKEVVKGLQREAQEKNYEIANIEKKLAELRCTGAVKELEGVCKLLNGYDESLIEIVDRLKRIQHDFDILEVDTRSLENKREKRLASIKELQNEVQNLRDELLKTKIPSYPPKFDKSGINALEEKLSDLVRKRGKIQYESSELKRQMEELNSRKKRFSEAEERRMEMLKRYHLDTYKAVCWLRENMHRFKDEIIEPPYIQLGIKDPDYILEVENFLGFQSLSPFICKSSEDFEMFVRIMKDEKKWGINVVEAMNPNRQGRDFSTERSSISRSVLKRLGFDGVLTDFIECRAEVMEYLVVVGHFDSIPISKKSLDESQVFKETDIKRMAVGGRYVEIKRSKYSNDYVIIDNPLKPRNLFSQSFSLKELEDIERELEKKDQTRKENGIELKKVLEACESVDSELRILYKDRNEYNSKVMDIKRKEMQLQVLKASVSRKDAEVERLKDMSDLDEGQRKLTETKEGLKGLWGSKCKELEEHLSSEEYFDRFREATKLSREVLGVNKTIEFLSESKMATSRVVSELENDIIEKRKEISKTKKLMEDKKRELERVERTEEYNQKLARLPETIEELNDEIIREKAQLEFYNVDIGIKDKFETQEQSLNAINETILRHQENLERIEEQTLNMRSSLIERIGSAVGRIDDSFRSLFRKVNCDGRVMFVSDDSNVSKWKLNIMVRFRSGEDFEVLSSYRQSGGEKSVSTILFLLAVQRYKASPFRLVDEINQGMDRYNEKLVHDILVELSEEESSGQFFIITPKIVPDLTYSRGMKVIILYPGNVLMSQKAFAGYKAKILSQEL